MSKKLPTFETDEEAIAFLEQADLSEYINAKNLKRARVSFEKARFEELPKTENVHFRASKELIAAVREKAALQGVPYQKFIRRVLESSIDT